MSSTKDLNTRRLILLALLTAIVVVLQFLAIALRPFFPMFTVSLVLLPIAVGASLLGVLAGGWLGFAFGAIVLLSGDAAAFYTIDPMATVLIVLLKGTLAGLAAGVSYKLLERVNRTLATITAAVLCPIVNTGIFLVGSYVFFLPTLTEWGLGSGYSTATAYIFFGLIGFNFLFEFGSNLVLSPTIVRLTQYGQSLGKNTDTNK